MIFITKTMENNKSNLAAVFLLLLLLVVSGVMQTKLKSLPQIFMIIFGVITLLFSLSKFEKIFSVLFYFLVGVLLSFGIFYVTVWILNCVFPESNIVEMEGEKRYVMNMLWLWGIPVSLIFTPLILFKFYQLKREDKKMEMIFLTLFLIMTILIFFKMEM